MKNCYNFISKPLIILLVAMSIQNHEMAQTINCIIAVSDSASKDTICLGENTTLSAYGFSPGATTTVTWIPGNLHGQKVTVTPSATTTYTVSVNNSLTGCSGTSTIRVNIGGTIPVMASAGNPSICNGSKTTLNASGGGGLNYTWNPGGLSGSPVNINPNSNTTYTVSVSDSFGCTTSSTVSVAVGGPSVTIANTANTCPGESNGIITASSTGIGDTYSWSNSMSTENISNLPVGTYTLTVTDNNECTATAEASVISFSKPVISISRDTVIDKGSEVNLFATGGVTYLWSPSGSLNNPNISTPVANPSQTTTYTVIITDNNDCSVSDTVNITVSTTTGIHLRNNAISFNVYPNPTSDQLSFMGSEPIQSKAILKIMDTNSKLLIQKTIEKGNLSCLVDIHTLGAGLYYFLMESDTGLISRGNFVINK